MKTKKEEATEYLTNYLRDFEAATKNKWELLEIKYWEMFGRGVFKAENSGTFCFFFINPPKGFGNLWGVYNL